MAGVVRAPSTILDRFRIDAFLGRGGMGELFLAHDTTGQAGDGVVVKTIRRHLREDVHACDAFQREIALTARFDHPGLVRYVADGDWEGAPVLVLQHIRGVSLATILGDRVAPLPQSLARTVLRDCACALAHVHALTAVNGTPLGIVHGDVSPHNIVIDDGGHARLIDFGAAMVNGRHPGDVIIGKPGYLAPERYSGNVVDGRADQYSLGVVLREMIMGVSATVAPPPRRIDAVLARMTATDARDRFADMHALLDVLPPASPYARQLLAFLVRNSADRRERRRRFLTRTTVVDPRMQTRRAPERVQPHTPVQSYLAAAAVDAGAFVSA